MLSVHAVCCCTSSSPVHAGVLENVSIGYSSILARFDYTVHTIAGLGKALAGCYGGNLASVNFRRLHGINDSSSSINDTVILIIVLIYRTAD